MPIPDYQTLMLPVLRLAAQGETRVPDVETKLVTDFGLTSGERDQLLPSGRQRVLHNRIHWAKFYLGKAGLVISPRRGRFIASDAGRLLLAAAPDQINVEKLLEFPAFKDFYRGQAASGTEKPIADQVEMKPIVQKTPEEQIEEATFHFSARYNLT